MEKVMMEKKDFRKKRYREARKRYFTRLKSVRSLRGNGRIRWRREELHER